MKNKNDFDPAIFKQAANSIAQSIANEKRNEAKSTKDMENVRKNIDKGSTLQCESCGYHVFTPSFVLKKLSPIISPTGEETIIPVQVFACLKCSNVNKEFLPSYAISDIKKVDDNGVPTY